ARQRHRADRRGVRRNVLIAVLTIPTEIQGKPPKFRSFDFKGKSVESQRTPANVTRRRHVNSVKNAQHDRNRRVQQPRATRGGRRLVWAEGSAYECPMGG